MPVAWRGGKTRQKSELTLLGKCPSGSGPWLCCLCLAFLVSNRGSNRKFPESSRKDCQRELFFPMGKLRHGEEEDLLRATMQLISACTSCCGLAGVALETH